MALPDVPLDRDPARSFVKTRTLGLHAQIDTANAEHEAIQSCAADPARRRRRAG
jgi:hypothetical protein